MIERIYSVNGFSCRNAADGKLLCLLAAYGTQTDFCRFFAQDDKLVFAALDGDFVICGTGGKPDFDELAAFICANGFHMLFTSEEICRGLEGKISGDFRYNALMEYCGEHIHAEVVKNPPLDDVYKVISAAFPSVPYEPWLLDTSHRVRHGVSEVYLYNNISTCTLLYDINGLAFITQVGTVPEKRNTGAAKALLREVAGDYAARGRAVQLVCLESMRVFYEKCGFERVGTVCQIYAEQVGGSR